MDAILLNRFRSDFQDFQDGKQGVYNQFQYLASDELQRWVHDIETESGWELDPALVTARTKIEEELRQRQARDKEVEREAILYPGTPGRPRKYASESERQQAISASKARYRDKHSKKGRASAVKHLGQEFVDVCAAQGLDPVTELRAILTTVPNPVSALEPQSNVDFGREPSNVDFS